MISALDWVFLLFLSFSLSESSFILILFSSTFFYILSVLILCPITRPFTAVFSRGSPTLYPVLLEAPYTNRVIGISLPTSLTLRHHTFYDEGVRKGNHLTTTTHISPHPPPAAHQPNGRFLHQAHPTFPLPPSNRLLRLRRQHILRNRQLLLPSRHTVHPHRPQLLCRLLQDR